MPTEVGAVPTIWAQGLEAIFVHETAPKVLLKFQSQPFELGSLHQALGSEGQ